MASSNIKLFDENKGNMLTDTEFDISTQRLNGLQAGIASSQLQNKAMYQASLVAYAIAQVMMQNGLNANDTDAVSAFVANLSGTMLQKVYDIATTEEAKAGVATGKWMSPALVKAAIDKTLTDKNYLPKSGGTMTGNLMLNANPTANLGAATKQYVDTQVNNAKTALTPVFGDLTRDGWFKLGNMSLQSAIGDAYYGFVYNDLYSFLVNNIAKLQYLMVLLANTTWKNISDDSNYTVQIGRSNFADIFRIAAAQSISFSRIAIFTIGSLDYGTYKSITLAPLFNPSNVNSYPTITDDSNENKALLVQGSTTSVRLVSGTAEIWYK